MKCINTVDAVGHVLCHDITRIVKDVVKDTAFRKGHVVEEKDIPVLLSLGKDHLYVWEKDEDKLHEDEAAQILYEVCKNEHMHPTPVKEGKIELIADCDGLFRVDVARLNAVNEIEDIMITWNKSDSACDCKREDGAGKKDSRRRTFSIFNSFSEDESGDYNNRK